MNRVDQDYDIRRVPALTSEMETSANSTNQAKLKLRKGFKNDRSANTITSTMALDQLQSFLTSAVVESKSEC